jgi:hypothetical protein
MSGGARGGLNVDYATLRRRLSALESEITTRLIERQLKTCRFTSIGECV